MSDYEDELLDVVVDYEDDFDDATEM